MSIRLRSLALAIPLLLCLIAGLSSPANARLNPGKWTEYNCYLSTSSQGPVKYESYGMVTAQLYYGQDNDLHGDNGSCEWLATVLAVQSRWTVAALFSVPVARYQAANLKKATGAIRIGVTSNAIAKNETSAKYAGSVDVSPKGVGVGFSSDRDFSVSLLRNEKKFIDAKLTSPNNCRVKERGTSRVYVYCVWNLEIGTLSYRAPDQRTAGGLLTMGLEGTLNFPGATSATVSGIFVDN